MNKKKILITGIDGYIGFALAVKLLSKGHDVYGIDNFLRRRMIEEVGSDSGIPILNIADRQKECMKEFGRTFKFYEGDLTDTAFVYKVIGEIKPDAVAYIGQVSAAPYSMMDVDHGVFVQKNNIIGHLNTLFAIRDIVPNCHIVKIGSMGEYKLGNLDIPEGYYEVEFRGKKDIIPAAKQTSSLYHNTKVCDTYNLEMFCRFWNLRATDVMQGVVYGFKIDEMNNNKNLYTRFDPDPFIGTVLNRFVAQAIMGIPLTVYGEGNQTRGFLPIRDSAQCLAIALENPAKAGEHRVLNQFEETYTINHLSEIVKSVAEELGIEAEISHISNPRQEAEAHYYNPDHQKLFDLGYVPTNNIRSIVKDMFVELIPHKENLLKYKDINFPKKHWYV